VSADVDISTAAAAVPGAYYPSRPAVIRLSLRRPSSCYSPGRRGYASSLARTAAHRYRVLLRALPNSSSARGRIRNARRRVAFIHDGSRSSVRRACDSGGSLVAPSREDANVTGKRATLDDTRSTDSFPSFLVTRTRDTFTTRCTRARHAENAENPERDQILTNTRLGVARHRRLPVLQHDAIHCCHHTATARINWLYPFPSP
jgi:hypothetical protein